MFKTSKTKLKNIKGNYDLRKKHHSHIHTIIRPEKHSHALLEIEYLHKISHLHTHYRTINKAGVFFFFIRLACSGRFSSFDQIKVTSLAGIWPFGRHFSEISREMCFLHTGFCIPKYRKIFHIWSTLEVRSCGKICRSFLETRSIHGVSG